MPPSPLLIPLIYLFSIYTKTHKYIYAELQNIWGHNLEKSIFLEQTKDLSYQVDSTKLPF